MEVAWVHAHMSLATAVKLYIGEDELAIEPTEIRIHPQFNRGVDAALIHPGKSTRNSLRWLPLRREPVQEGELIAVLGYPLVPQAEPALSIASGEVLSRTRSYLDGTKMIMISAQF